jgi:hypothetical protein
MRMRIAIIAAGAGTFALAQTDLAQAGYAAAPAASGTVASPDIGSASTTRLAENQSGGTAGTSGSFQRTTSGSFQRGTSGSFQRNTSGSFQRLPKNKRITP